MFTRASLREVDRLAESEFGIPPIVLMENAARHVADVALDGLEGETTPGALVVCGPGKNGGDGLAAARHLHNAGLGVRVLLVGRDEYTGESAVNRNVIRAMGIPVTRIDPSRPEASVANAAEELAGGVVIDAVLGTGLSRPVEGELARAIDALNTLGSSGLPVLSVDCPSGMDVDSGEAMGAVVRASVTVTLVGLKTGFLTLAAQGPLGEVVVGDIGVPRELVARLGRRLSGGLKGEARVVGRAEEVDPPAAKGRRMR